jgi:hypothetical protein
MIRKSLPSGFDPTGGIRFSEKIMLKQKARAGCRSNHNSSRSACAPNTAGRLLLNCNISASFGHISNNDAARTLTWSVRCLFVLTRRENPMRKRILAVTTAAPLGAAMMTTGAMVLDQGGGAAERTGHWARVAWRADPHVWRANGRGLPFGPPLGALYSYGLGHACDPYDPFTALYGYCGGPYHYRR